MQAQGIPEEEHVFSKYAYVFMQKQLCILLKSYLNSSIYLLDKWIGCNYVYQTQILGQCLFLSKIFSPIKVFVHAEG